MILQGAFLFATKGELYEKNNQKTVLAYKRRSTGLAEESEESLLA